MKGFFKSYLLVDLTARSWQRVALEEEDLRKTLGGKGLGLSLLKRHLRGRPDPLSPENPLIFAVGPVTDSKIAGSSRWVVMARSPLTGFLGHSYSGGRLSTPMSRTGYDAFVVEGASDEPVWLEITPDDVIFHDARDVWGMNAHDAEQALLERTGSRVGALVIGPAGENRVRFATISNGKWRQAGRTGMGAVLGSKNVKGIAFKGDRQRPHADRDGIRQHWKEIAALCKDNQAVLKYRQFGTPMMVAVLNNAQAFPSRYWHQGVLEGWEEIAADALLSRMKVQPKSCEQCPIACGKLTEVVTGPRAGLMVEGPEYETIFAFGGLCMIRNLDEILYLNDLCDKLGVDTISTGNLVAFAMEASDLGKFPGNIAYGDAAAAEALIRDIARKRGVGAVFAEGIVHAARSLGLEELAVHVKGMEPAGYDPRVLKGMALAYGVSDRGACHLRTTFYKAELSGMIDKDTTENKAALFIDFEDRATLFDSLILCRFYRDLYTWDRIGSILEMTTGLKLDKDALAAVARQIADEARRFNMRMGLTKEDDTLPKRFHEEPLAPSDALITKEAYGALRADYYRIRGWSEDGVPT